MKTLQVINKILFCVLLFALISCNNKPTDKIEKNVLLELCFIEGKHIDSRDYIQFSLLVKENSTQRKGLDNSKINFYIVKKDKMDTLHLRYFGTEIIETKYKNENLLKVHFLLNPELFIRQNNFKNKREIYEKIIRDFDYYLICDELKLMIKKSKNLVFNENCDLGY